MPTINLAYAVGAKRIHALIACGHQDGVDGGHIRSQYPLISIQGAGTVAERLNTVPTLFAPPLAVVP
jgi:hypothetical protein